MENNEIYYTKKVIEYYRFGKDEIYPDSIEQAMELVEVPTELYSEVKVCVEDNLFV